MAAAAGAVIVGGDDERLALVDRLALETEIADAMGVWRDKRAVDIVARGLRHIDRVGDAVDDVEIIGGERRIDQRLLAVDVRDRCA